MGRNEVIGFAKGILRLIDVVGWQKWFGAGVLGFAFALNSGSNFSLVQLQGLVVGLPLILIYIQSVNDCFDVEIDLVKEKLGSRQLTVSKVISQRTALTITFLILLIGLLSAWAASLSLFLLCCIMALFGTVYSAPPFRLKMEYPFSTLIQFAHCFLPFLAGVAFISTVTFQTIIISSFFAFLAMIQRFKHEIENYKVDKQTGKKTVAVVGGLRTAQMLGRLCAFVAVVEFAAFLILGWLNVVLTFLFVLYVFGIIMWWKWLSYMNPPFRTVFARLEMVSSYILFFIVLLMYGKI